MEKAASRAIAKRVGARLSLRYVSPTVICRAIAPTGIPLAMAVWCQAVADRGRGAAKFARRQHSMS
jgi:hypothetical protein